MKTIYEQVSNINYDTWVSFPCNDIKIVSPQDSESPFWWPKMAQNAVFQQLRSRNSPKLMKTIYEQVYNINYDTWVSFPCNDIKIVSPQDAKSHFWWPKMAQNAVFQQLRSRNSPKLMKTIYEQLSNINYDTLMSFPCNDIKIVRPQDTKKPFWGPKMAQNAAFSQ